MSFIATKKIKGHEYRYLVENVRINGKVKQKILQYLGRVDPAKPKSFIPTIKKATPRVHANGGAWISISRKLKGKRVEVEYRYKELPDR